ncbi:unnamed protein product [Didymodactylos carnosus]|uniref:Exportin-1/Importin-beta-like domain-containing protein n=1 Tax=Didymodactylos carnosus TaxID=1234261 RepID=A0A814FBS1_9BILA|nr:unnamed protein product [Didymodactylos carnosus]CAF0980827.1 unnamed protein product [Didymodactylos carnosus]CAF3627667.1 unnamed protein product [Didymodactylos carnosus]CAF3753398.1 unnamed protein product [Didymodactylos carnosus]
MASEAIIDLTPENFIQAVQMLYHDNDSTRKKFASEWLLNVQSSLYAWTLTDQLIRMNGNPEVTCLSAQILRHKIQHNFDELPFEHCKALCDSMLDHLSRPDVTKNQLVRVQLAVATADLALQYVGWEKPVDDVVDKLKTSSEHMLTLLEFLSALPEELNTSTIHIGENRRRQCTEKYSTSGPQIHEILLYLLQLNHMHEPILIAILKCFSSWIMIRSFDETLLLQSALVAMILEILKSNQCSNDLNKVACNCLCNMLELCEDYQAYYTLTVTLKNQINGCFRDPYFQAVKEENLDKAQNYSRIYSCLVETLLDCIVDGRYSDLSDLSCIELLLLPVEHTDYEVVQCTFCTWYKLSELLQSRSEEMSDKIKPYIERLIDILCIQSKLDSDHLGIPPEAKPSSKNSDFGEFRYRVACLIKDVIYITGALNCFRRMFDKLQTIQINSASWEESEAPLYIMSAVASYILPEEDEVIPKVVQAIVTMSSHVHTSVKYTGIKLLGQLDEWLAKHQQYIKSVIDYLLSILVDQDLRSVSAEAILTICSQCRKQVLDQIEKLMQATLWLDQTAPGSEATLSLLKASSKLISRLSSTDEISHYLNLLFDRQREVLSQLISVQSDGNYGAIIKRLDSLTAIFRYLDFKISSSDPKPHPCIHIVQQLWPLLETIILRYRSSGKVSEFWSRTIRFILRSMGFKAKVFFEPIVKLVLTSYDENPHSCFLYLTSVIVDEYGDEKDLRSNIIAMSEHLATKTFALLAGSNGFKENPDVVDDFYRLAARLLQRCPLDFLKSNLSRPILAHVVNNCHLEHREASASMMAFLQSLVKLTSTPSTTTNNNNNHGHNSTSHKSHHHDKSYSVEQTQLSIKLCDEYFPDVILSIIKAVSQGLPYQARICMAEFICDLKIYIPEKFCLWLKNALLHLPREHKQIEIVTIKQQEAFYSSLCEADAQPVDIDYAFAKFANLYR